MGQGAVSPTLETIGWAGSVEPMKITGAGAGGGLTGGVAPVQASVIRSGLLEAFVETVMMALREVAVSGAQESAKVQVALGASVAPHSWALMGN